MPRGAFDRRVVKTLSVGRVWQQWDPFDTYVQSCKYRTVERRHIVTAGAKPEMAFTLIARWLDGISVLRPVIRTSEPSTTTLDQIIAFFGRANSVVLKTPVDRLESLVIGQGVTWIVEVFGKQPSATLIKRI